MSFAKKKKEKKKRHSLTQFHKYRILKVNKIPAKILSKQFDSSWNAPFILFLIPSCLFTTVV